MENEQELQPQDYQDNESVPVEQDERVDIDGGEPEDSESSNENVEKQVAKIKEEFNEQLRSMQSIKDRELAEAKAQLNQAMELLKSKAEPNQEQDITSQYFDEDGYAKEINAKDVAAIVQDAIRKDREQQQRQYEEQTQQQTRQQQEQQAFIDRQPDKSDVLDYYGKNQKKLEDKMRQYGVNSNDVGQAYLFVRSELALKKAEEKQKPNTPPVGNQGTNYTNRSPAKNKSPMQQAVENASKRTFSFLS